MRKSLLAVLIVAAAAPGGARDRNILPIATPAGKAVSCIPLRSIREGHVRNDRVIDFEMLNRKVYRNTLPRGCPGLAVQGSFGYETALTQLCSTDLITVIQTAPLTAGLRCGLGQFQPVTLPPRTGR